jgi:hypothetical protein
MFSFTDDVVLDPFLGSGTTCRVAKDEGRRSIGIEIDESFCAVSADRCRTRSLSADELSVPRLKQPSSDEQQQAYLLARLDWARSVTRRSRPAAAKPPVRLSRYRGRTGT